MNIELFNIVANEGYKFYNYFSNIFFRYNILIYLKQTANQKEANETCSLFKETSQEQLLLCKFYGDLINRTVSEKILERVLLLTNQLFCFATQNRFNPST